MLYVSLIFDPVEWNGKQPTPKFQNGLPIAPAKFCFVNNLLKWTEDCQEGGGPPSLPDGSLDDWSCISCCLQRFCTV